LEAGTVQESFIDSCIQQLFFHLPQGRTTVDTQGDYEI